MEVKIYRTSGPVTDEAVTSTFDPHEFEIVKDVLAMVNKATGNKEGWCVEVEGIVTEPRCK